MNIHRIPALSAILFSACMLASCGGHRDRVPLALSAILTGGEQVPQVASTSTGSGVVTVDEDRATFTASVIVTGPATGTVHIHEAQPGAVGPALFTLDKVPGTNAWTLRAPLNELQLAALRAGNYYFDVHTAAFPNGEIRGRIEWLFPSSGQIGLLQTVRQQSPSVELQLQQLQEIEDDDERFTGVGLGLTVGF